MEKDRLYLRWQEYHAQFLADEASRETVVAAYTDWADAVDSVRHEAFEAREGGKMLRWAGIIPDDLPRRTTGGDDG